MPKDDLNLVFPRVNLEYCEEMYKQFIKNPLQMDPSWRIFFQSQGLNGQQTYSTSSSFDSTFPVVSSISRNKKKQGVLTEQSSFLDLEKELQVFLLFQHYRDHASLRAKLDPLGENFDKGFPQLERFTITVEDLEKNFFIGERLFGLKKPLKDVLDFLEKTYCGSLALNAKACEPKIKDWFFKEFEQKRFVLSKQQKYSAFESLSKAACLEKFFQVCFLGKKRFSLEGLEALIPMLDYLLEKNTALEMKNLCIGMSHRGRINVLVNIMKQNPQVIFSNFDSSFAKKQEFTKDVQYHLGFSSSRQTLHGLCELYLGYNPSHLESIGAVICGVTRAIQRRNKDTDRRKTAVPLLIHGDAAFCGQGAVSETLQLSKLKGYTVGGTIHIILNNQIGFTTEPKDARSSLFASDLASAIDSPVLLVNADDLPACLKAMDIACRFRYTFGLDVFIELVGYRRYGHNEGDEASFTQPIRSKKIKHHPSLLTKYQTALIKDDILTSTQAKNIIQQCDSYFEKNLDELRKSKIGFSIDDYTGKEHKLMKPPLDGTNCTKKILLEVLDKISKAPKDIQLHPKIKKILNRRKQAIVQDQLDWAMCELLAYGSLLKQGFSVRLTGQDSKRGTFSHRHGIYFDYNTQEEFSPLKQMARSKEQEFCLYNSPLSEMAVLAFEYGNSCLAPDFLTLWEAQFGDFVNGAQIIIDQFISSGEIKWLQSTDIVLLLPHGYEGQGPEHSSAYLERFLQLCAENNMRVCNLTTGSNLFHALRRQKTLLKERKPLVLMTPKSLLRHPQTTARLQDLTHGEFQDVIWDKDIQDPRDVTSLVLCSGKVYYDLKHALHSPANVNRRKKSAVFRLEQLYPFPDASLNPILNGFPCLSKIMWLQEEPYNRGAWLFIRSQLLDLFKKLGINQKIHYYGRPMMATSAEGSETLHKMQQEQIIKNCIAGI